MRKLTFLIYFYSLQLVSVMDLNTDFMHLIDATSNDFSSTFAVLEEKPANANVIKACHVPDYGS